MDNSLTMVLEMDTKLLAVLNELLKRTPLKGEEVPEFVDVLNSLNSAINKTSYIDNLLQNTKENIKENN